MYATFNLSVLYVLVKLKRGLIFDKSVTPHSMHTIDMKLSLRLQRTLFILYNSYILQCSVFK